MKVILKKPIITEKSTLLASLGKYVFEVVPQATRPEILKAVSDLYKVKVIKVNLFYQKGKVKKRRTIVGRRKDFKKAIVTLAKGQKIEGFELKE